MRGATVQGVRGGMPLVLDYKGVVSATEIKITGDFMGMPFEFTVKKS